MVILKDKTVFLTGGSRGIGRAIANRFAKEGARLFLMAREKSALEEAREEISKVGTAPEIFAGDIANEHSTQGGVELCLKKFGTLDIVVVNAGVMGTVGPLETNKSDQWQETVKINLFGTFFTLKAVIPILKRQGRGKIIIMGGGGSTSPTPQYTAYGSSKAAVMRLSESVAEELRGTGVEVNALAPGPTKTKIVEGLIEQGVFPESHFETSFDAITEMVLFLASHESDGLTGRIFSARWDSIAAIKKHKTEIMQSDVFLVRRIMPHDRGYEWE